MKIAKDNEAESLEELDLQARDRQIMEESAEQLIYGYDNAYRPRIGGTFEEYINKLVNSPEGRTQREVIASLREDYREFTRPDDLRDVEFKTYVKAIFQLANQARSDDK